MSALDYYNIIKKQRWIILGSFLVITALAGAYLFLLDPVYESVCKILIVDDKTSGTLDKFTQKDIMVNSAGKSDPVLTQLEIINSKTIIHKVIKSCNIRDESGEFSSYESVLELFRFEHVQSTNLIKIYCRNKSREKSALYANSLAEVLSEYNRQLNMEEVRTVLIFLKKQILTQKSKVENAEKRVIDFKAGYNTVSLNNETKLHVNALAELEVERMKLESELKGLEAQLQEIDNRINSNSSKVSPGYSSLTAAKEQISILIANLQARLGKVKNHINLQYRNMKSISPLELQLAGLEREERIMVQIYTDLLSKYEEYKIREIAGTGSIKIVEQAIPSNDPVFPQKKKGMAIACILGLSLGLGMAFSWELIKNRPANNEEIKKILQTNLLGVIPVFHKLNPLFMKNNQRSAPVEAMRLIQTNLQFNNVFKREHLTLMVTSAQPQEGKSMVAANLAVAFSNAGKKTALVSLDFRRPAFDALFNRTFDKGVTDILSSKTISNQIYWNADFNSNLTVFSSGHITPDFNESIVSSKITVFIEKLKSYFDVIFFDTAPITMVAETLELARNIDGIIIVADQWKSSRIDLNCMQELLQGKGLPVLGVIVNKVENAFGSKYYKHGVSDEYGSGKKAKIEIDILPNGKRAVILGPRRQQKNNMAGIEDM